MTEPNKSAAALINELNLARAEIERLRQQQDGSIDSRNFYALLDGFTYAVAILDAEGMFLAVNHAAATYLDAKFRDIIGNKIADFLPTMHDTYVEYIRGVLSTSELQEVSDAIWLNERLVWVNLALRPIEFNGVPAVMVIARDVTAQQQAIDAEKSQRALANALVKTAERINSSLDVYDVLHHIVDAIANVVPHHGANIMLFDSTGTKMRIAQVCGCYAENGLAIPEINQVWLIKDFPTVRWIIENKQLLSVTDTQKDARWQYNVGAGIRSYMGAPIMIDDEVIGILNIDAMQFNFFSDSDEAPMMALATQAAIAIQNARLYQRLQVHSADLEIAVEFRTRELEQANEELIRLSEIKDAFVSNVSHELRSPITSMKMQLQMLEYDTDRTDIYIGRLKRETDRLETLIEDLLRLSRLEQGNFVLELRNTDLNRLLDHFVNDRREVARRAGLKITFQPAQDLAAVRANAGMLEQVLGILFTNAVAYTPSGGQITVTTTQPDTDHVAFVVSDTGPGIATEEQEQIFERFSRGSTGRRSKVGGTGLGLSIAAKIMEFHGGAIDVQSPGLDNHATSFIATLPAVMPSEMQA